MPFSMALDLERGGEEEEEEEEQSDPLETTNLREENETTVARHSAYRLPEC